MDRIVRDAWIKDLRSGEYAQHNRSYLGVQQDGKCEYCCLGVLVEHAGASYAGRQWIGEILRDHTNSAYLTLTTLDKIGMTDDQMYKLARMNDKGMLFSEIADWIEANL